MAKKTEKNPHLCKDGKKHNPTAEPGTLRPDIIMGWIVTVRCLECGERGYTNLNPNPVWGDGE